MPALHDTTGRKPDPHLYGAGYLGKFTAKSWSEETADNPRLVFLARTVTPKLQPREFHLFKAFIQFFTQFFPNLTWVDSSSSKKGLGKDGYLDKTLKDLSQLACQRYCSKRNIKHLVLPFRK